MPSENVSGLDGISKMLAKVGDRVDANRDREIKRMSKEAVNKARQLVPVRTGELRNSIRADVKDGVALIGSDRDYAADVEYGTFKMPARPYIRPAVAAQKINQSAIKRGV